MGNILRSTLALMLALTFASGAMAANKKKAADTPARDFAVPTTYSKADPYKTVSPQQFGGKKFAVESIGSDTFTVAFPIPKYQEPIMTDKLQANARTWSSPDPATPFMMNAQSESEFSAIKQEVRGGYLHATFRFWSKDDIVRARFWVKNLSGTNAAVKGMSEWLDVNPGDKYVFQDSAGVNGYEVVMRRGSKLYKTVVPGSDPDKISSGVTETK